MAVTMADITKLRKMTGAGMMDCKKALTETDGDMDKAVDVLREKGLASAAKKAGRVAAEGVVVAYYDEANKVASMVEVNCETDFVAKNEKFVELANKIAVTVAEKNPADVDALLAMTLSGSDETVSDAVQELFLVIRENMKVRRFVRVEGTVASYIHGGGSVGVLVSFDTDAADKAEFKEMGRNVAMQIAALNTPYLNESEVPAEIIEHEKEVMRQQVINEGKPEQIADKIVMGKIGKFYKENCLLDQEFVKDNKINIKQYTQNTAKELGGSIEIKKFVRFEKGEGIEKRQDDFAAEVASMVK